ncbi:hypothetical protein [Aromatoleum toluclasticum]|uniref:hypothetical protein n=1 Tax=Aromatoleum toluclasticum TaxID=92003 RepID=UPI001D191A13|nr:hypothetical protein [Aromatoleum toluclasticum]
MALLEVPREDREAHQQAEQVGEGDPIMAEVTQPPCDTGTRRETGKYYIVLADDVEAGLRDLQGVVVEQRHAEQRERKQDEIDGYASE